MARRRAPLVPRRQTSASRLVATFRFVNRDLLGEGVAGKLKVSMKDEAALTATRVSVGTERMVYVLVANKRLHYRFDTSKIAYIGTTKRKAFSGLHRA